MGPNIQNRDVEELARQINEVTGEARTEAIRKTPIARGYRPGLQPSGMVFC